MMTKTERIGFEALTDVGTYGGRGINRGINAGLVAALEHARKSGTRVRVTYSDGSSDSGYITCQRSMVVVVNREGRNGRLEGTADAMFETSQYGCTNVYAKNAVRVSTTGRAARVLWSR